MATTGYYNLTELINLKIMIDKANLDSDRISDLIKRDMASPLKHRMAEGTNYYNSKHDYLDHKNFYYLDGQAQEDATKANNKLIHPFHKILVDQKVSYICGKPVVISVTNPTIVDDKNPTPAEQAAKATADEFQGLLTEQLSEDFDDILNDWVTGASNKAQEWIHFYITPADSEAGKKGGDLEYIITPGEQIIPIYDSQYEKDLVYVIRFYTYDLIDAKGELATRYKVEWWSKTGVEYWAQQLDNRFIHDPDYEINPGPHWFSFNTLTPGIKNSNSWGRVPFVNLNNNSQLHTDLQPVKGLIDAYDKVKSGWLNDLDDFQELIYIVKNYEGLSEQARKGLSELAAFVKNIKTDKAVLVDDRGGVETLKAEIPVEAKLKFLDITRKEIFYFGQGVDVDNEKFGNSPSGVSLQFLYASLDLKADRMIRKLKKALPCFMWFVTFYINLVNKTKYNSEDITFTFNKSTIFNIKEKIDGLVASGLKGLDQRTLIENHPYVDDPDLVEKRLEEEKADQLESGLVDLNKVDPNAKKPGASQ